MSYSEFIQKGELLQKEGSAIFGYKKGTDELAAVLYTSGTTGPPKGKQYFLFKLMFTCGYCRCHVHGRFDSAHAVDFYQRLLRSFRFPAIPSVISGIPPIHRSGMR